jgi:hypothetical protein
MMMVSSSSVLVNRRQRGGLPPQAAEASLGANFPAAVAVKDFLDSGLIVTRFLTRPYARRYLGRTHDAPRLAI